MGNLPVMGTSPVDVVTATAIYRQARNQSHVAGPLNVLEFKQSTSSLKVRQFAAIFSQF
jgi:hypothetical protein